MAEPSAAQARDLGDYAALVRRRWRWVAGFVLAGFVMACAYLLVAQTTYVATAKVLVEPVGTPSPVLGARTDDPINLDTEAQLVRSEPVATRAAELLGSELSPVSLADRVSVTVPPNTTVLAIAFAARTAEDAQQGAETFARAYIENRAQMAQDDLDRDVKRLQHQAKQTTRDIRHVNESLDRLTGSGDTADQAFLLARRRALSKQLTSYNTELAPIVGEEVDAGLIIVDAQLPEKPVEPNPWLALPTGVMLGLVIGLAFAAWRERADTRIHSSAEVERIYGVVPLSSVGVGGHGEAVRAQDVRALYYQLRSRDSGHCETVLLVGPDALETAERLSRSLAVAAARSGARVSYLTRPNSPARLDRERITAGSAGLLELPDYAELGVLVRRELRPAQLMAKLRELQAEREFVILDLPSRDPAVDLPVVARYADVAVVVIRLGISRRDTVAATLADLTKAGADDLVVVTVAPEGRRRRSRAGAEVGVQDVGTADSVPSPIGAGDSHEVDEPPVPDDYARVVVRHRL